MLVVKIIATILFSIFGVTSLIACNDEEVTNSGKGFLVALSLTQVLGIVLAWV